MKTIYLSAIFTLCCGLLGNYAFAQNENSLLKKNEEIIIRKNDTNPSKTIIEIDSNNITINGKPLSDYNGNVTIMKRNFMGGNPHQLFAPEQGFMFNNTPNDNAFLGVLSAKTEKGVVINKVLDTSSAKRAGLEKGDIITKVNDKEISSPEDLRTAIQSYKPGDKVSIDYLRDGNKKSVKVVLGKTPENVQVLSNQNLRNLMNRFGNGNNYQFNMPEMPGQNFDFNFHNNRAQIGLQIQDTEDSSGVKIQKVIPRSPADRAGLKEGDIITEMNGYKINDVNNVNNVMSKIKDSENRSDYQIEVLRDKNKMDFEVHIPRPLRSTNI